MNVPNVVTNSRSAIQTRIQRGQITWTWPLLMLVSRLVLFALWQGIIALIFAFRDLSTPWAASTAWWPATATLTNLVSILLLVWLAHREGIRWVGLSNVDGQRVGRDLLLVLGVLIVSLPVAYIPNVLIATWLFGDPLQALDQFVQPLPFWAAALSLVLFPVTIALAELPTYFGYVMPRLAVLSNRAWIAIVLPAFFLSVQHVTLPLIFDWRFLVWRGTMFLGFAFVLALALYWRRTLLPYLMVAHALLDAQVAWMVFSLS